jgi:hypothetical protein
MEFDLLCINCKHYNIDKNNCNAFKVEIPYEIYVGLNDHSEPLPEQENNIIFEPIDDGKAK